MCQVIGHPPLAAIREEASDNGLPALEDSVSRVSQKPSCKYSIEFHASSCILHPEQEFTVFSYFLDIFSVIIIFI
jgi:hypothetical protein